MAAFLYAGRFDGYGEEEELAACRQMDGQRQLVRRPVRSSPIGEYSPECVIMPNLAYLNHYL